MLPLIKCSVREYERQGCPLMMVRGLEVVALDRVIDASGLDRKAVLRMLGERRIAAVSTRKMDVQAQGAPLFARRET